MSNFTDPRLNRQFLRAPLKSICLYVDGEHVFKARGINISESGILLSDLPHFPEINSLPVAIDLIQFPKLQLMNLDQLKVLNSEEFERKIIKIRCRMVRTFEGKSNVDKIFVNFIGLEFYQPSIELKMAIFNYVETFSKNTIYLLSLFESIGKKGENLELLRSVAHLLGYDRRMKVPLLRAKVLHDYQSLESL